MCPPDFAVCLSAAQVGDHNLAAAVAIGAFVVLALLAWRFHHEQFRPGCHECAAAKKKHDEEQERLQREYNDKFFGPRREDKRPPDDPDGLS